MQHQIQHSAQQDDQARLLTEKQLAAAILGMSVAWVRRRRYLRQSPRPVFLGSAVRYRLADVEAFIESLTAPADTGEVQ